MATKDSDVHITDMQTFLQCRRRWKWSSLMRDGLQPAVTPAPLFLGQGVHVALDAYYTCMQVFSDDRDDYLASALAAFKKWTARRVELIREWTGPLWDSERSMIAEMYELGMRMLTHYHLWVEPYDRRFEIIATERKFREVMSVQDPPLALAGRFDGVVRDIVTGDHYLLEFKTTSQMRYAANVMKGIQGTAYVWAAQRTFGNIKGILYRHLLKKIPTNPKPLKTLHMFSQSKAQKTSFEWYRYYLDKYADHHNFTIGRRQQLYEDHRDILIYLDHQNNEFFSEHLITRTPQQLHDATSAIVYIGREMQNPNMPIFPMPGFYCSWCSFSDPCDLIAVGGDYEGVLDAMYARRDYWEESDED